MDAVDGCAAEPLAVQDDQPGGPSLTLDGYTGPLDQLLALARAHRVDLARLSLPELCDQLVAALLQASNTIPLSQRGEWLVMAAWLLQLRSRLLLPADEPAMKAADAQAGQLRRRLSELEEVQALAAWLQQRPHLGHDVFARGRPDWIGTIGGTEHEVDVVEFLWASMALFDTDLPAAETAARYRPVWLDLHPVPDARKRIRRLMAGLPEGAPLMQLLPLSTPGAAPSTLKKRSALTSTFVASLELAKQGVVLMHQTSGFGPIHVVPAPPDFS